MRKIYNILIGKYWNEGDKNALFANNDGEIEGEIIEIPENYRYPQLLKHLGIFRSCSDASNNGWNKDIPEGFTFPFIIGKFKTEVCILKMTKECKIESD